LPTKNGSYTWHPQMVKRILDRCWSGFDLESYFIGIEVLSTYENCPHSFFNIQENACASFSGWITLFNHINT
jgi:hypothetical protein